MSVSTASLEAEDPGLRVGLRLHGTYKGDHYIPNLQCNHWLKIRGEWSVHKANSLVDWMEGLDVSPEHPRPRRWYSARELLEDDTVGYREWTTWYSLACPKQNNSLIWLISRQLYLNRPTKTCKKTSSWECVTTRLGSVVVSYEPSWFLDMLLQQLLTVLLLVLDQENFRSVLARSFPWSVSSKPPGGIGIIFHWRSLAISGGFEERCRYICNFWCFDKPQNNVDNVDMRFYTLCCIFERRLII